MVSDAVLASWAWSCTGTSEGRSEEAAFLGNPVPILPVLGAWVVAASALVVTLRGLSSIEFQGKRGTESLEITLGGDWGTEAAEGE